MAGADDRADDAAEDSGVDRYRGGTATMVVMDDMDRARRRMTHGGRVARRLVVHGCFHRTPSAVRRREGRSAESRTSETRDQDFLNRLVHITPLYVFVVTDKPASALREIRDARRRFLTEPPT